MYFPYQRDSAALALELPIYTQQPGVDKITMSAFFGEA